MRQERGLQTVVISVLAVAILVMSVGFASYAANLNINGTATFAKAKWSVHFDTSSFQESGDVSSTAHNVTNTDVTYTVTLAKPGDTYSFDVDVINEGTMDATLSAITITPSTTPLPSYVSHKVTYDGHDYTASSSSIPTNTLSKEANSTPGRETVTVTLEYVEVPAAQLPENADTTVTFTVSLDYTQAS